MKINIAIDGPSAAGKSTIADLLAKKLGYIHLDTGAMYRCVALKAKRMGIALDDEKNLCSMLSRTDIAMTPEGTVFLDGEDVSSRIREEDISMAASDVSKQAQVRADLVKRQQEMAQAKGFIMDGRDIGTVVLTDAGVKIFLTASAHARAERRYLQNKAKGIPSDLKTIEEEIEKRDYQDSHRKNSPLRQAADAVRIDSSDLSIEQVADRILKIAEPVIRGEVQQ
jgi:cytidylate kinase